MLMAIFTNKIEKMKNRDVFIRVNEEIREFYLQYHV